MNIYIGNLNYTVKEEELSSIFGEYGTVESVKIVKDHNTGRAKGFAFITMPDNDEAQEAITNLDQKEFFGRKIKVVEAQENPKPQRRPNNNSGFRRNYNR